MIPIKNNLNLNNSLTSLVRNINNLLSLKKEIKYYLLYLFMIKTNHINNLQWVKRILFLIFVVIFFSSCTKKNEELYGTWSVYSALYNDTEISGAHKYNKIIWSVKMVIDGKRNNIKLPLDGNKFGKFNDYCINDTCYIEIFNSDDIRFNRKYKVNIKKEIISPHSKTYDLILFSDSLIIYATKEETNFNW